MTEEQVEAEKLHFKMLISKIEELHTIPFQSESGKKLINDMEVCYSQIIKPMIVKKANEFITEAK